MLKKKNIIKISTLLVCFAIIACFVIACGSTEPAKQEKTVSSISVSKTPTKTKYYIGEVIDLSGGILSVSYSDNSQEHISFSDKRLEINNKEINMNIAGNKTITVKYSGARTTFIITVEVEELSVTFDLNYDGSQKNVVKVKKGKTVAEPQKPTRPTSSGKEWTFEGWFSDDSMTFEYDFSQAVTDNITLYALWISGKYDKLTLDYNYYGVESVVMKLQNGEKLRRPVDPVRLKHSFVGWYNEPECVNAVDFNSVSSGNKTIYAKWNRTDTAVDTYRFEAENIDLSDKSGPGYSGTASGKNMIVSDPEASNMQYVGFLYEKGITLDFYFACSQDVSDASIFVGMSADIPEVKKISSDTYGVRINGVYHEYDEVTLTCIEDGRPGTWVKVKIGDGVSLKKGLNTVELITLNDTPPSTGSTYAAMAPIIDYIEIKTSAVVEWDASHGLPWFGE